MKAFWKSPNFDILVSWLIFILGFFLLFPIASYGIAILSVIPSVITGWTLGPKAGFIAGLITIPINALLVIIFIGWQPDMINPSSAVGTFFVILSGVGAGALNKSLFRTKQELALRTQAETKLIKTQERYRSIIDAQDDLIDRWLPDTTRTYVNPAYCRFFGKSQKELIGSRYLDELNPIEKEYVNKIITSYSPETPTFTIVSSHTNAEGELRRLQWHDYAQFDENGKLTEVQSVGRDVTEIMQAQEAAEQATQIKSEFLAHMSHEIRTPMNGVIGMTSLLLNSDLTSEQREFVETIRISGEALLAIINDILDFSKIEADKLKLEMQEFSLLTCIEDAFDLVARPAAEKGIELAYNYDPDMPFDFIGDATRLRQILVNLLSNAVKFTEEGSVTLNVSCQYKQNSSYELQFAVKDTGIGIPKDRQDVIFQSFSQVDSSTTRRFGGTGLGLAICKQLTEMMGGNMTLESKPGEGTTFTFWIQLSEALHQTSLNQTEYGTSMTGKKILVVETHPPNQLFLSEIMSKWDIQVQMVSTETSLKEAIRTGQNFDAILIDAALLEMNTIEGLQNFCGHMKTQSTPVILMIPVGSATSQAQNICASAWLTKPIKVSRLFDTLSNVFTISSADLQQHILAQEQEEQMAREHPLRILLAEDNLVNQKVALKILEKFGYRADLAANGMEVLQALRRQDYDVVLMDVQMPEMSGEEATQLLRERLPEKKQPYIIALTANAMEGDRERFLAAGMDDYLSKPMRSYQLRQALINAEQSGQKDAVPSLVQIADSTPHSDIIDRQALNEIVVGFEQRESHVILLDLIELFMNEAGKDMEKLRQALDAGSAKEIRMLAHSIKGSSLNIGAKAFAQACANLEIACRENNLEQGPALMQIVEVNYKQVQEELKKIHAELKG
jgi:PAS domain S-box-containing protein